MNRVFITGNLTRDPETINYDGGSVCTISIAVSREYGEDVADFFTVKVFGKQGENCATYLTKGSKIGLDGRIENRKYTDKDGNTRYATEIIANRVEFLGGGEKRERAENKAPYQPQLEEIDDNKLPF